MTIVNKTFIRNRPLPSTKNPHFQNEAKSTTFLLKTSRFFLLLLEWKTFPYQRRTTQPRFETQKWPSYCLYELVTSHRELKSNTTWIRFLSKFIERNIQSKFTENEVKRSPFKFKKERENLSSCVLFKIHSSFEHFTSRGQFTRHEFPAPFVGLN